MLVQELMLITSSMLPYYKEQVFKRAETIINKLVRLEKALVAAIKVKKVPLPKGPPKMRVKQKSIPKRERVVVEPGTDDGTAT